MIGRNVLVQLILTVVSSLIGFASLSLSARIFGPFVLGHLAYVLGITGLIFSFSDLGLSRAQIHFTAAYNSAKKTLGTFLILKSILLFLTSLVALTLVLLIGPGQFKGVFFIVLATELLARLAEGIFITFEGLQLSWPQNLARLVAKFIRLIAIVIIGFRLTNIFGFGLTYLIESVALIVLGFCLIRSFWPLSFSKSLSNKYFLYSLPFVAIVPISYAQTNLLTVLLKYFHSSSQVGFYSAAFSLAMYLKVLFGTVMIFFFPRVSSLFGEKNFEAIQKYLNLALKYLLAIFIPIFMVGFLLRREIILFVLGQDFAPSVPVFTWMLLAVFVLLITNPYDYVLYATKKHARLVGITVVSLVLVVVLSFLLMSYFSLGAVGAALVNVITWIISGLYSIFLVKKHLKFAFYKQAFYFVVPAVIWTFIANAFFSYYSTQFILKLGLCLASALAYWLFIYMVKLINPTDIKYFRGLIKFK